MAKERGRRRRGHRRGRGSGEGDPEQPAQERPEELVSEESEAPGVLPSRFRFRLRRRKEKGEEESRERPKERPAERSAGGAAPGDVSPLAFWRRGSARTYREQPLPRRGPGRLWRRLTGFYFPPWVPVVAVIIVVFAILGLLFVTRSATGAPRIGRDHWHATYQVFVCGERQPNFPEWEAGVHTHADGVIHIHPFVPSEEGSGARLVKWFEYGGGKLTRDEMRMPGRRETMKNDDPCPDGTPGVLQLFVNGQRMTDWSRYIPRDGDRVRIVFGPEEEEPIQQEDRTIISEGQATRTSEIEVTDDGTDASTRFQPGGLQVNAEETVKVIIKNTGSISHGVRVSGDDGEYGTSDDFVSVPTDAPGDIIPPGGEGVLVMQFSRPGEVEFRDLTLEQVTGTIIVREAPVTPSPTGEATGSPAPEDVAVTLEVTMGDNFFEPAQLEVEAGERFRIDLVNDGSFVHNLRIAGPDGEFRTADDLVSSDLKPGETGDLVGQIDERGRYKIRDDFHPTEMTGTIIVR